MYKTAVWFCHSLSRNILLISRSRNRKSACCVQLWSTQLLAEHQRSVKRAHWTECFSTFLECSAKSLIPVHNIASKFFYSFYSIQNWHIWSICKRVCCCALRADFVWLTMKGSSRKHRGKARTRHNCSKARDSTNHNAWFLIYIIVDIY